MAQSGGFRVAAGRAGLAAAALLISTAAAAAPCEAPEFRSWDFWIGDWEVFDPAGQRVGSSRVESIEQGCALLETWAGRSEAGRSLNVWDPVRRSWTQLWIGGKAIVRLEGPPDAAGAIVMSGDVTYLDRRISKSFRGEWRRLPTGEVRQHFEERDPASGEWKVWFTGLYKRKP
jgi:hypothetical protein